MDEAAFFLSTEMGDRTAAEVFRAIRPSIAQFGEVGQMIVSSSPMGPSGWFADYWHQVERGEMDGWRAWQVPTAEMSPARACVVFAGRGALLPGDLRKRIFGRVEGGSAFFDMQIVHINSGLGFAEPHEAHHWVAGPGGVQHGFGVALVGVADGQLMLGPVTAFRQERGPRTFEFGSKTRDRVLQQVADLCRRYGATAYLDQHQTVQIVSRLRELGAVAHTVPQTREAKWLVACFQLRGRVGRPSGRPVMDLEKARVTITGGSMNGGKAGPVPGLNPNVRVSEPGWAANRGRSSILHHQW